MKKYISLLTGMLICFSSFGQQIFTDFQEAGMVIGQPDFGSQWTDLSDSISVTPSSIAISSKGMLAIAELKNGSIKIWYELPEYDGKPADVEVGNPDFITMDPGPSEFYSSSFDGVAWSPDGNKLIASCGEQNRVLIWNTVPSENGQPADVVLGQKDFYSTDPATKKNCLDHPAGIHVTPDGRLLVADKNNNRVLIWNAIPVVSYLAADVVIGQESFNSSIAGSEADQLDHPVGVHLVPDGKLLITNELLHHISVFDSIPDSVGESATLVIGHDDFGNSSSGTSETEMNMPYSVLTTYDGKLAVAEYGNNRVLLYNSMPGKNGAEADIVLGQKDFTSALEFAPDGSPANNNLGGPSDVAADLNGRLWVAGISMNRVMVFGDLPKQSADLQITMEQSDMVLCEASDIVYKISVINAGPDTAYNVVATAAFPLGYVFEDSQTENGTYNKRSGYWQINSIAPGENATLLIDGIVNTGVKTQSFTSYASITGSSARDDNLKNNAVSSKVTIQSIKKPDDPTVSDAQVCYGERTMIFADGSGTILWFSGDDYFASAAKGTSFTTPILDETSTYYAKTFDVCPGSTRVPIQVEVIPHYSISDTVYVCSGSSLTFPDGTTRDNITSATSHTSYLTTAGFCDSTITTYVYVNPVYDITEEVFICTGENYTFPDGSAQNDITSNVTHISNLLTINNCDSIITTIVNVNPVYALNETIMVCSGDSYIFPDGYTESNITSTVMHISNLPAVNGCDSLITTTITVNQVYNLSESVTLCAGSGYTFPDGTTQDNIVNPVSHTSILSNIYGCDSTIVTNIEIAEVNVFLSQSGLTLTADATDADYQWIDCDINSPIYGETGQSFIADQTGNYAVIVSENGCSDTSECYGIDITGMEDNLMGSGIKAYPNPAKDKLSISLSDNNSQYTTVTVINLRGQIVLEQVFELEEDVIELDLHDLGSGMYLIRLNTDNMNNLLKIRKE